MSEQIIVIIGASSGIGLKTAEVLSQNRNNTVVCASRSIEKKLPVSLMEKFNVFFKNIDVSSEASVKHFFTSIGRKYGRVNAIINCAGYVDPKGIFEMSYENWKETLDVNLSGVFNVTKYGCFLMKKTGGRLVNIASTAGMTSRPGWSAYAAAKSGVINFSMTMAEELKVYNIKVFIVAPGRTATPLRKILAPSEDPMSIMQPEAVSDVIAELLNGRMDVLEGQPIMVRERF